MIFYKAPSDYRRAVLSVMGHQLQGLTYCSSSDVDFVAELFPYPQLKKLSMSSDCTLSPFPAALPPVDTFLPHLMKLVIRICLGQWSLLLECHRPSLVLVRLACPHFEIASRSHWKWSDIPNVWPNLRRLTFDNTERLEQNVLFEFIPKLKRLQLLTLPYDFVEFVRQMRNQTSTGLAITCQMLMPLAVVDH